ncbi:MAG: DUF177 domain-containing protein [Bacteroidales bacterium]|nr:DUF177 domain-containing protein [Bacteroidales bacterium]
MLKIPFSGLSLGYHKLEFHVDDTFFEAFDYDEISDCKIKINIDLEKTERFLKLDFHFNGKCFVPCDRCLDPVEISINHEETLITNFGNENDFDSEVWTIAPKEHELILDNFIYEVLVLLRPLRVMHDIEDCNPDMLKKLQASTESKPAEDPRWDALKALKNNLDKL